MTTKRLSNSTGSSRSLVTATRMIAAVSYLADVAAKAGLKRIAHKLDAVRDELLLTVGPASAEAMEQDASWSLEQEWNAKHRH